MISGLKTPFIKSCEIEDAIASNKPAAVSKADDGITGDYAPNQSETAYAYVHSGYLGKADVKVDAAGKLSVTFDEAFLPHVLAAVNMDEQEWTSDNTMGYISHGHESFVAKYISYNDKIFETF